MEARIKSARGRMGNASLHCKHSTVAACDDCMRNLSGDVSKISGRLAGLQGDASNIKGDVTDLYGCVSKIRGTVSALSGHVSFIRGDVSGITGDVSGIKGDVSGINGDVTGIRGDVSGFEGEITHLALRFRIKAKLRDLKEGIMGDPEPFRSLRRNPWVGTGTASVGAISYGVELMVQTPHPNIEGVVLTAGGMVLGFASYALFLWRTPTECELPV